MRLDNITIVFTALILTAISAVMAFGQAGEGYKETTRWDLIEADGKAITKTDANIQFEEGKDRFTGNTGCNSMFGTVEIDDPNIRFKGVGMTRKFCRHVEGNVAENVFVDALNDAATYTIAEGIFTIFDSDGTARLKFREQTEETAAGLTDIKWNLEKIESRADGAVPKGAFVKFGSKEKSVGGNSGCNVFGGDYKGSGNTLEMGNLMSTMMACENLGGMDNLYLRELGRADKFAVEGDRLRLYEGKELLLTFKAE